MFLTKVKKLIFKFIFHLFNYRAIKIVNLSKKNRNLYILSNYKKKEFKFNFIRQVKNYNFINKYFKRKLFEKKKNT